MPTVLIALAFAIVLHAQSPAPAPAATTAAAREPSPTTLPDARREALRTQVMLDRARFSPGAIDGHMGGNTTRALEAYRAQAGTSGPIADPLTAYALTAADVAGPFTPDIPDDLVAQAALPALGYRDAAERVAERFHTTPGFLRELNPGATFVAGEVLQVPNVEPLMLRGGLLEERGSAHPGTQARTSSSEGRPPAAGRGYRAADARRRPAASPSDIIVTVRKATSSLTVTDADGRVVFYAPVTTGSEHDPLPIGEWKVNGVERNPPFHYSPDLFWDAEPSHSKATIAAGPNNPVGLVWIDIDRPHYGLHGTPAPELIGHAASHGCVRLTNWDAATLADLVTPGTTVRFVE